MVSVDLEKSKLRLSLNTSATGGPTAAAAADSTNVETARLESLGKFISSGTVVSKSEAGMHVEFESSGQILRGYLAKAQTSDFYFGEATSPAAFHLFDSFTVGLKIKNLLVVNVPKDERRGVFLTLKPELLRVTKAGTLPKSSEDVDSDTLFSGYVANTTDFGVFVRFLGDFTILVPSANILDVGWVAKPADYFAEGQTVRVRITSVDPETNRVVGSLKPSVVGTSNALHVSNFLEEQRRAFTARHQNSEILQIKPGKAVTGRVTHRAENVGVAVELINGGVQGFCTLDHCPQGKLPRVGTELTFRVLDVDYSKDDGIVDLSARKSLEKAKWREVATQGLECDADVEIVKNEYMVVSFASSGGSDEGKELAFCALVGFNDLRLASKATANSLLKFNATCRVCTAESAKSLCNLELVSTVSAAAAAADETEHQTTRPNRPRARSGSLSEWLGPRTSDANVGSIVNARIRDIKGCWMKVDVRRAQDATTKKVVNAQIHSCDVIDPPKGALRLFDDVPGAFSGHSVGDVVRAKIVEAKGALMSLSLRPSELEVEGRVVVDKSVVLAALQVGDIVNGWVDAIAEDGVWVGLSRNVRGFCFCTDICEDLQNLDELFNKGRASSVFSVGRPVRVKVLDVDLTSKRIGLKMMWI